MLTAYGCIESFNGKLRDECLNVNWFWKLFDAWRKISAWKTEYNSRRIHSSLGYLTNNSAIIRQSVRAFAKSARNRIS